MLERTDYALSQRIVHWLMAIGIIGLFALGFWMVDLTYYSEWYRIAPHWHQSIGFLLALMWVIRVLLIRMIGKPTPLASHTNHEKLAAHFVHIALYVLMLGLFASGYLISTADGRAIPIFSWFELPGFGELFQEQADIAGAFHKYSAYGLIGLVVLHAAGALKHHFVDKDDTLKRMLRRAKSQPNNQE